MQRTIGQRIAERMAAVEINQPRLADLMGVSNQSVSKWVNGHSIPTPDRLAKLAGYLDTTIAYLLTGATGQRTMELAINSRRSHGGGRMVPVVNAEQAIDIERRSQATETALSRFPCGEHSFQLSIWDSSNGQKFLAGDTIVIDPDLDPVPGDMVLAAVGTPRRPMFAQYTLGDHIELVPLDAKWPRKRILTPSDGEIVGVMTEHSQPRRV